MSGPGMFGSGEGAVYAVDQDKPCAVACSLTDYLVEDEGCPHSKDVGVFCVESSKLVVGHVLLSFSGTCSPHLQ